MDYIIGKQAKFLSLESVSSSHYNVWKQKIGCVNINDDTPYYHFIGTIS